MSNPDRRLREYGNNPVAPAVKAKAVVARPGEKANNPIAPRPKPTSNKK